MLNKDDICRRCVYLVHFARFFPFLLIFLPSSAIGLNFKISGCHLFYPVILVFVCTWRPSLSLNAIPGTHLIERKP